MLFVYHVSDLLALVLETDWGGGWDVATTLGCPVARRCPGRVVVCLLALHVGTLPSKPSFIASWLIVLKAVLVNKSNSSVTPQSVVKGVRFQVPPPPPYF